MMNRKIEMINENTSKKRCRNVVDYRCPHCGSRNWSARKNTNKPNAMKYRCNSCKKTFNELRIKYIVADVSVGQMNGLAECPSCNETYWVASQRMKPGTTQRLQCECGDGIFDVSVDEHGNTVIVASSINEKYIEQQIEHNIKEKKIERLINSSIFL